MISGLPNISGAFKLFLTAIIQPCLHHVIIFLFSAAWLYVRVPIRRERTRQYTEAMELCILPHVVRILVIPFLRNWYIDVPIVNFVNANGRPAPARSLALCVHPRAVRPVNIYFFLNRAEPELRYWITPNGPWLISGPIWVLFSDPSPP